MPMPEAVREAIKKALDFEMREAESAKHAAEFYASRSKNEMERYQQAMKNVADLQAALQD